MSEKQKIGVGMIGPGGMGVGHHLNHLMNNEAAKDRFTFIGGFDIREERQELLREKGFEAFPSREALLSDPRIELVVVATPNEVHEEIVIDALQHGKHVVCEKPVTMTLESLDRMIAASKKAGKLFTVHQNRRWDQDFLIAKEIFDKNTLGDVFRVESRVHGSRGIPQDWRSKKFHGGGMLLDWGIHLLDQMLQMMGDRKLLTIHCQLTNITTDEVDDGFRLLARFEGGIDWQVEVLTNNFLDLPRWYILGNNGTGLIRGWNAKEAESMIVMVEDWENKDALPVRMGEGLSKTMAPRDESSIKKFPLPDMGHVKYCYYHNIYEVIRNGAEPIVKHEEQRRLIRLLEIAFESHSKNQVLPFTE